MSTLTNGDDRNSTTFPTRADNLDLKVFAHWDSTVYHDLGDTVPISTVS